MIFFPFLSFFHSPFFLIPSFPLFCYSIFCPSFSSSSFLKSLPSFPLFSHLFVFPTSFVASMFSSTWFLSWMSSNNTQYLSFFRLSLSFSLFFFCVPVTSPFHSYLYMILPCLFSFFLPALSFPPVSPPFFFSAVCKQDCRTKVNKRHCCSLASNRHNH